MPSRYDAPYKDYQGIGKVQGPSAQEQAARKKASGTADWLRMLAGVLPAAGSAAGMGIGALAGGPVGAGLGGAIGGGLGQLGGSLAGSAADSQTREFEDKDAERQAKLNALMSVLGRR